MVQDSRDRCSAASTVHSIVAVSSEVFHGGENVHLGPLDEFPGDEEEEAATGGKFGGSYGGAFGGDMEAGASVFAASASAASLVHTHGASTQGFEITLAGSRALGYNASGVSVVAISVRVWGGAWARIVGAGALGGALRGRALR